MAGMRSRCTITFYGRHCNNSHFVDVVILQVLFLSQLHSVLLPFWGKMRYSLTVNPTMPTGAAGTVAKKELFHFYQQTHLPKPLQSIFIKLLLNCFSRKKISLQHQPPGYLGCLPSYCLPYRSRDLAILPYVTLFLYLFFHSLQIVSTFLCGFPMIRSSCISMYVSA